MDAHNVRRLRQRIETEKQFGVEEVPLAEWRAALKLPSPPPARAAAAQKKPATAASAPAVSAAATAAAWEELEKQARACTQCRLAETRTNVVFGQGNRSARLMFVGEAPGADEDEQGLPFVGRAGQLLTKIIEAMGLKREDVYIANCLKCRPPNNRPPLPDEIAPCRPFLRRQVELVRPAVICTLGKSASHTLLETETPISKLRGNFQEWNGIKVMPTFHPAYLLRNPADKKIVWEDMQKIMAELGLKKRGA